MKSILGLEKFENPVMSKKKKIILYLVVEGLTFLIFRNMPHIIYSMQIEKVVFFQKVKKIEKWLQIIRDPDFVPL